MRKCPNIHTKTSVLEPFLVKLHSKACKFVKKGHHGRCFARKSMKKGHHGRCLARKFSFFTEPLWVNTSRQKHSEAAWLFLKKLDKVHRKTPWKINFIKTLRFNAFAPNAPFLYPLKLSENPKVWNRLLQSQIRTGKQTITLPQSLKLYFRFC